MDKGVLPAAVIAKHFLEAFYRVLHDAPDDVHKFYQDQSELSRHGAERLADKVEATGTQAINELINSLGFERCTVLLDSADAQYSENGSVVVTVTGQMGNKSQPRRPFVQTFVLARDPNDNTRFYVRNDVMRYTDTVPHSILKPSSSPIPAASPPLSVPPNVSLDGKSPRVISPRPQQPVAVQPSVHIEPQPQPEPVPEPLPPVQPLQPEQPVVIAVASQDQNPVSAVTASQPAPVDATNDAPAETKPPRKKLREPRERRPRAAGEEKSASRPKGKKREGKKKDKEDAAQPQDVTDSQAAPVTTSGPTAASPTPQVPAVPSSWAALVTKAPNAGEKAANGSKPAPKVPVSQAAPTKAVPSSVPKHPNGIPSPTPAGPVAIAQQEEKLNGRSSVSSEEEKWQKIEKRGRSEQDKSGGDKGWEDQGIALYIGALPSDATEKDVRSLFESYGDIVFCQIPQHPKNCAYVHFALPETTTKVMDSRPFTLLGTQLNVQRRKPHPSNRGDASRGPRGGRGGLRGRGRGLGRGRGGSASQSAAAVGGADGSSSAVSAEPRAPRSRPSAAGAAIAAPQ